MKQPEKESFWGGVIKSMGLVFGDIGTSPIYTLTVIFALTRPTYENVLGILSLVVWTLTILVTVEYAWLATSLSRKGQGGEIVLREILLSHLKSGRAIGFAGVLTYMGVSLLLGDGVITPAITLLSAVEGLLIIPGMENLSQATLIGIAAAIAIALFIAQSRGADRIAGAFGPVMLVWFGALALSGLVSLSAMPDIVKAVNPWYAFQFFQQNGIAAFFVLSEVILCATGGEALYADMGHLGRKPILQAWNFVFVALLINYFGQGVFAIQHPEAKHFLFGMVRSQAPLLYIPFLLLTVAATIIASQAIISSAFSIVYQGITTRLMPLMKIDYTSRRLQSQIYIGAVNWILMISVIFIMFLFQRSSNLAAAYGMAVTGSMTITSLMMIMVFSRTTKWKVPIALAVCAIDFVYLASTFTKLPHGAYWSLIIASVPFFIMLVYTKGQKMLFRRLMPLDMEAFLISYEQVYGKGRNIAGTALFFTRQGNVIPPYIVHCILGSSIIYENNIFISITRTEEPFGIETDYRQNFAPGLHLFEIRAGYMTVVNIEKLLKEKGIQEKIIFYGVEDITTKNIIWKAFSMIKKLSPNFVQFHKLPARKLHGVVTRVEM
ncbi:MAG: potassium transport protein Kup [Syntrophaceae bacterium PtaB.Bin095]|nr:MAG: potassium transport protein Kup [Syntrophaceae bacterium PtaB.Bin095]